MKRIIFTAILVFFVFVKGNSQAIKNKYGEKIYGDFNGDGKLEYAFRVLVKKGYGNPVEDGQPDVYEVHFSDKNIKPIRDDFYWFTLINEGDLDNDGSDEISVREDPMNGCVGIVKTFTIKNGKSSYLFEPFSFYRGACDNDISINPQDLVENDNGIVYYYEYNADADLEPKGGYSVNGKGKKIFGKKIKAFEVKPIIESIEVVKNREDNNDDDAIYNSSGFDVKADFPSGMNKFYKFIGENFQTPLDKKFEGGKVVVDFVIEKDGTITDIKVIRDLGYGTKEETIRVLKLSPKWIPAEKNGKKVRTEHTLPIILSAN